MKTVPVLRLAGPFLVAVLACTVTGTVVQTQFNLAAIEALGAPVPPAVRLTTTGADLARFAPTFGAIVALGFAIAMPVAAALRRRWPAGDGALHAAAGATAIGVALQSMVMILGLTPVAAARGPAGFAALCICGALGGYLFARLRRRTAR